MNRLIDLYEIWSPSHKEEEMSLYIQEQLKGMKIPFDVDKKHQIYRFLPNTPLLVAHMDQVSSEPIKQLWRDGDIVYGDGNLGADDKNGIWIILNLLEKFPNISFIFSAEEESGLAIDNVLESHESNLEEILYALVFDRRGGHDILGCSNYYCVEEFESDVLKIGTELGFKLNEGLFSDCDALAMYISCVNISCGYYRSHSEVEFTNISELHTSLEFGKRILTALTSKYDKPNYNPYGRWWYKGRYGYNYNNFNGFDSFDYYCPTCQEYVFGGKSEIRESGKSIQRCWDCNTELEEEFTNWSSGGYYCPECELVVSSYIISGSNGEKVCIYCDTPLRDSEEEEEEEIEVPDKTMQSNYFCTACDRYIPNQFVLGNSYGIESCPDCDNTLMYDEHFEKEPVTAAT